MMCVFKTQSVTADVKNVPRVLFHSKEEDYTAATTFLHL